MRSALIVVAVLGVSCASSTDVVKKPSDPTTAHYQVVFPSTAVAATTDSLQVLVFDATNASQDGTDCLTLITKRRSGAELPNAPLKIVESPSATPCDLLASSAAQKPSPTDKGAVSVTYGNRSFLVVTERGGSDYFLGCATKDISSDDALVEIPVSPANATISVPSSTCQSLSDKCASKC